MSEGTPMELDIDGIYRQLWPDSTRDVSVFALLDGARDPEIVPAVHRSGLEYECLFGGELSPSLRAAAPHIVRLTRNAELTYFLIHHGWGRSWGVFALAWDQTLHDVRHHFRKLMRVKTEEGKILFFRFYDPRVLRVYLPTCTAAEVKQFYGSITLMMAEAEAGDTFLAFRKHAIGVETKRIPVLTQSTAKRP